MVASAEGSAFVAAVAERAGIDRAAHRRFDADPADKSHAVATRDAPMFVYRLVGRLRMAGVTNAPAGT